MSQIVVRAGRVQWGRGGALREDESNDRALRCDARELRSRLVQVGARADGVAGVLCSDLHPENPPLHYLLALQTHERSPRV